MGGEKRGAGGAGRPPPGIGEPMPARGKEGSRSPNGPEATQALTDQLYGPTDN